MDDVRKWLNDNGFERFADLFEENEIDSDALRELGEDHLKELGIPLGPRVKLLKAIASLEDLPHGNTQQSHLKASHGAERRQLTVMFVDLVGSTALSGKLDPEEMRAVITSYQRSVSNDVSRYGGHVAKYMGDGVLCYFGWPAANEDDAERAVRAGLAIVETIATLSTPDGDPLAARVGIATGLVVVGDLIGEGAAQEEAVIGETPNLAARLQGLADTGQVVLDGLTHKLAGRQFGYEDLGLTNLKGIANPTQVWRVIGDVEPQDSRFEASHAGVATSTVGRTHEAGMLLDRWKLAKDGEGQVVLLSGEAGIGKSHLTQVLRDNLHDEHHYRLRFQCSPHQISNALYPVVRQLEYACGIKPDDVPEAKLDKLEQLMSMTSQNDDQTLELLATLLGLNGKDRYGELDLTVQQRQNQTFAVLTDQVMALS
ncbi:MAG: AAA family ATPase, partial [Hyphomicrobiales bacterium]|nr:AAA family ATPase [Hyphomicrobiales bacterium]